MIVMQETTPLVTVSGPRRPMVPLPPQTRVPAPLLVMAAFEAAPVFFMLNVPAETVTVASLRKLKDPELSPFKLRSLPPVPI